MGPVAPFYVWRRGWDSNPRYGKTVHRISNPAHSTTLPPLRGASKGANDTGLGGNTQPADGRWVGWRVGARFIEPALKHTSTAKKGVREIEPYDRVPYKGGR